MTAMGQKNNATLILTVHETVSSKTVNTCFGSCSIAASRTATGTEEALKNT